MIELVIVAAAGAVGYVRLRDFVKDRLRFVEAAQKPATPWLAGIGTALAISPLVSVLPIFGGLTVIVSGLVVGTAVRSGQRQVKLLDGR